MVRTVPVSLPMTEDDARGLRAGDLVLLSGNIVTGRDRIHKFLLEQKPSSESLPFPLAGSVLYHCGPIMKETEEGFIVVAAGPTTSMRVEMYEHGVIGGCGIRGVMGKGGMGDLTRQALVERGCVYMHTIGGAAVYLAERITKVLGVWMLEEFGLAEAMWHLEVKDFPAIVTMDAHGNDTHREIEALSLERFREMAGIRQG
ncbi:MAG: FumA C-terminus/TtdB family hydratase beta subunit [Nitrospiraceae bacterium]|nr:FumA C-terminus/TtdB family hydratase beta subunit [Nitrospiraceae bacterium]